MFRGKLPRFYWTGGNIFKLLLKTGITAPPIGMFEKVQELLSWEKELSEPDDRTGRFKFLHCFQRATLALEENLRSAQLHGGRWQGYRMGLGSVPVISLIPFLKISSMWATILQYSGLEADFNDKFPTSWRSYGQE